MKRVGKVSVCVCVCLERWISLLLVYHTDNRYNVNTGRLEELATEPGKSKQESHQLPLREKKRFANPHINTVAALTIKSLSKLVV